MLEVRTLTVGPIAANCHLVFDRARGEALVVDPGDEPGTILDALKAEGLRAVGIWLTHAHIDHVGAAAAVKRATGAPLWAHRIEEAWLADPVLNLAAWAGVDFEPVAADGLWDGGETTEALGVRWRVLHSPGHSPGHVALIADEPRIALTGDLVFDGSMGRVDLPGGDPAAMAASLRRLFELEGDYRLYVGHGPMTTLARERRTNHMIAQFIRADA